jgi:hypothetical protein
MYPKNIESGRKINPVIPVIKMKNIAVGMNNNINIFAGIETKDKTPVR